MIELIVACAVLIGFLASWFVGYRQGYAAWRRDIKARDDNERGIEEAKRLYELGLIDQGDLETRVGHLHDWPGRS